MPDELDHPELRPQPGAMSDERLDKLLVEARWPQVSPAVLERIAATLPPAQTARRGRAWWIGTLAAAAVLAVAAMLWALWPTPSPQPVVERRPGVEQVEPAREPEAPRLHYAVLPGREATTAERAWAQVIRREQALRDTAPPSEQSQSPAEPRAPAMLEKVRPGPAGSGLPRAVATRSRTEQLLETLLDPSTEPSKREDAARLLPAGTLEQAMRNPEFASSAAQLAAALAISQDPAAAKALVRLAERDSELAAGAVASAPASSAGVLGLVACLDDPVISRREKAASLLATSSDPAVFQALARRLSAPAARREVLITLLSSEAPTARALLERAQTHPQLSAIVNSLRLQGYGPARRHSHLQMTIL